MFVGLVGKPSAGKSTFFKALTLMDVARANYPFTTIKPNSGVGFVKIDCADKELGVQCNPREGYCVNHKRFVPVQVLDVAGLVPGAHEGKGLGLEFLNDLSQADALIHIVDVSGSLNERGEPIEAGTYDPAEDIRFLEHELDMWYYQIFQKVWKKFSTTVNQTKENTVKAIAKQFSGLKVNEDMVKEKMRKLNLLEKVITSWTPEEVKALAIALRKETKPIIIAANKADIPGAYEKYMKLKAEFKDYIIIPCSSECELALKEAAKSGLIDYTPGEPNFKILQEDKLSEKQKKGLDFLQKSVLDKYGSSGVQHVINGAVFELLKYVAIFPGGVNNLTDSHGRVMPDCFLMPPGTTALSFAFHLHTQLGEGFIRAINVKNKLQMKKDEPLHHRDVIEIVHNG
ncbi:MAG: redox-regulated ATPase YchF [Nanoarchaeota archaeon]|nr:redox-regulated ATPase YchF [Nanoarchaeota archaeon]